MECPACSNKKGHKATTVSGVYECGKCGALFGQCYLGDSYNLVMPYWDKGQAEKEIYYDLTCLGSKGIERRHG